MSKFSEKGRKSKKDLSKPRKDFAERPRKDLVERPRKDYIARPQEDSPKQGFVKSQKEEGVAAPRVFPKGLNTEMKIYGANACEATFERRIQDIVKVYVETDKVKNFSRLLKKCAEKKIAYKIIPQEEMNKVTESGHHEGICCLVKKKEIINFKKFLSRINEQSKHACVVALEKVQNPHNIGAILRVCANFAVDALLLQEPQLAMSGAVCRTAEGGAEWVQIIETGELVKAIEEFKKQGFTIYGSSSHAKASLQKVKFSKKSVILFGSEADGLSPALTKCCDHILLIPTSGHVESLNVSCAASVILYQHHVNITQ